MTENRGRKNKKGKFRLQTDKFRPQKKIEMFCPKNNSSCSLRIKSKNASESNFLALSNALGGMWHTRPNSEKFAKYRKNAGSRAKMEMFCPKKYSSTDQRIKWTSASERTRCALSIVLGGMRGTRTDLEKIVLLWVSERNPGKMGKNRFNSGPGF